MALSDQISDAREALDVLYAKVDALKQRFVEANALSYEDIGETINVFNEIVDASDDASVALGAIEFPIMDVEGTDYIITVPAFIHNNVTVTAEELAEDADLAAELIEMESSVLVVD